MSWLRAATNIFQDSLRLSQLYSASSWSTSTNHRTWYPKLPKEMITLSMLCYELFGRRWGAQRWNDKVFSLISEQHWWSSKCCCFLTESLSDCGFDVPYGVARAQRDVIMHILVCSDHDISQTLFSFEVSPGTVESKTPHFSVPQSSGGYRTLLGGFIERQSLGRRYKSQVSADHLNESCTMAIATTVVAIAAVLRKKRTYISFPKQMNA